MVETRSVAKSDTDVDEKELLELSVIDITSSSEDETPADNAELELRTDQGDSLIQPRRSELTNRSHHRPDGCVNSDRAESPINQVETRIEVDQHDQLETTLLIWAIKMAADAAGHVQKPGEVKDLYTRFQYTELHKYWLTKASKAGDLAWKGAFNPRLYISAIS